MVGAAVRRVELRAVPPPDRSGEPGYREWHASVYGCCAVCGWRGRLERHHVVLEQHVRAEGGDPWCLDNSLLLGTHCRCHSRHTTAAERLPISLIGPEAIAFAQELLGEDQAAAYFVRYYRVG